MSVAFTGTQWFRNAFWRLPKFGELYLTNTYERHLTNRRGLFCLDSVIFEIELYLLFICLGVVVIFFHTHKPFKNLVQNVIHSFAHSGNNALELHFRNKDIEFSSALFLGS